MTIEFNPQNWKDYELLDSGRGAKLERFGEYVLARPEPKALWDKSMTDEEWKSATHACLVELYAKSKELGGQLSGEHGIGNGRLEFLKPFIGDEMYQLYRNIKLAFDPKLILNPGKMITFD